MTTSSTEASRDETDEDPSVVAGQVDHLTRAERAARGRAQRVEVPRSSHASWESIPHRRHPVEMLEEQATTRIPELVPIRYGRMLVSPFTFFRGAAYLMAADLAGTPRTGLEVQLCGDAHLSNFGVFAAPDRRLTFSVNDFDETLPGPFEWDVKRLAASFAVAGRDRGFDTKQRQVTNLAVSRAYRLAMHDFAKMGTLDLWYSRLDIDAFAKQYVAQVSQAEMREFDRNIAKARTKDGLKAFTKLTHVVDGERRFISDPPLVVPVSELLTPDQTDAFHEAIRGAIRSYRESLDGDRRVLLERFHYVDCARKVVGVGSVGTRAWIVLMAGNDENDPLILQLKEAEASVLEPFLGKSRFAQHGERVVNGQRLMQSASDILLGWLCLSGVDGVSRDFYMRQLWDGKGSAVVEVMNPRQLTTYAEICGWTLARAHARSGDSTAIASYLGNNDSFDRALATFAEAYADQNERDYDALRQAVDAGTIKAAVGL